MVAENKEYDSEIKGRIPSPHWDANTMDGDVSLTKEELDSEGHLSSSGGDLEELRETKRQKRLFSWLIPGKAPPIPSEEDRKYYPWHKLMPWTRVFFWWLNPLLYKGYKRTLTGEDLWRLSDEITVERMYEPFEKSYKAQADRAREKYIKKHGSLEGYEAPIYCVLFALFKTFGWQYLLASFYLTLAFCDQSLSPLLSKKLIEFVQDRSLNIEKTYNKGVGYTMGAVAMIWINGLLLNHFFFLTMTTGAQVKAVLTKALFLKSLRLSNHSKRKFTASKIMSFVTTDLARIDLATGFQPVVVCFPIPFGISIALLMVYIGPTALTGIGLFLVSFVLCLLVVVKVYNYRKLVVKYTDERIRMMREAITYIKMIKYYAWEIAYKLQISKVRRSELKILLRIKVLRNIVMAYAMTLPIVISMLSFTTLWAVDSMKQPSKVFSSLSLFTILASSIMLLPYALTTAGDAIVGLRRCAAFLETEEEDEPRYRLTSLNNKGDGELRFLEDRSLPDSVQDNHLEEQFATDEDVVVDIRNADFFWDDLDHYSLRDFSEKSYCNSHSKDTVSQEIEQKENVPLVKESTVSAPLYLSDIPATTNEGEYYNRPGSWGLHEINLTIKKGEFIALTGTIGSGKSSLLAAIAGYMRLGNPGNASFRINDEFVFCSDPWIQNTTVRNNITFSKPLDMKKYSDIIKACCLGEDLKVLPGGDLTEIGERGVTLSGGQKARVNLARACYSGARNYLFDDVISAVDAKVGKNIVDQLFCGFLKGTTRILATHHLSVLEKADRVLFLNADGTVDCGTVSELNESNEQFKNLLGYRKYGDSLQPASEIEYPDLGPDWGITEYQEESEYQNVMKGRNTREEERAVNAINWDIYKKFISLGSGIFRWTAMPIFLLMVTLATFVELFTNTWLSFWTEKKFSSKSDYFYVGWYVGFAFFTVLFAAIEFALLGYFNITSSELLNVKAMQRIMHAPMSYFESTPLGRILNRFSKDTDALDNEIGEELRLFIFPFARIIGIIVLSIIYLPWFAIAVPFFGIAVLFIAAFYQASSREIKRLESTLRSLVFSNFNETLTGIGTIKTYKAEDMFIKKNDASINKMNEAYYISITNQRWLALHLDMVASAFALIICMLCVTGQFNISASSTGLLLNYVFQIVGLLSFTIRAMTQVENEMNSVERLYQYAFRLPEEAAYTKTDFVSPEDWPAVGYIEFKNVSLRYRPHLPLVLKNLDFSIYPNEKVGICGRTGAGKTSIMSSLYRLVELEQGSIFIDGLNIADLGLYDLRSKLSIIPQDPILFRGTIRKNLDLFNQYDDTVLWDALRRSGLLSSSQVEKFSKGKTQEYTENEELSKFHLDLMVDNDGINFSLGERQLIALARALVRTSKVLILDEATASVDLETDEYIQKTITREFRYCTILCIAHRLNTILHYDRILVMDEGRIVQKGTPIHLFKQGGYFRDMCDKANITINDF